MQNVSRLPIAEAVAVFDEIVFLVLAESTPALSRVWAHAAAMIASSQQDVTTDARRPLSLMIQSESDMETSIDIDPGMLRTLLVVEMRRALEGLDPHHSGPSYTGHDINDSIS